MKPVLFNISEDRNIASNLPNMIQQSMSDEKAKILLSYPIVYIHYWPGRIIEYTDKHGNNHSKQLFNVYVGDFTDYNFNNFDRITDIILDDIEYKNDEILEEYTRIKNNH